MKISYECSELIEELELDIEEFGNIDMYAFFDRIGGNIYLTDYDFIDNEPKNVKTSTVQIMKASEILKILKKQNELF
jgi:hypothetical protein